MSGKAENTLLQLVEAVIKEFKGDGAGKFLEQLAHGLTANQSKGRDGGHGVA